MKVFVTGATGWVGSVVVPELISHGHQVIGLARSDESAAKLVAAGAEVQRGSLTDLEALRTATAASDGVIHLGFIHDFSKYAENCEIDRNAITAMSEVLAGTNKPLVVTSGTLMLPTGRLVTETEPIDLASAGPAASTRGLSDVLTLSLKDKGVRSALVRLPPSVHGDGDKGFIPALIGVAKSTGVSGYVGDGANRWSSAHRIDIAKLYRLVLEKAPAGTSWHGSAEEGIPIRDIATVIGKKLNLEVVSKPVEHFGWLALAIGKDNPTSSAYTKATLGWEPTQKGLLADMEEHYFKA